MASASSCVCTPPEALTPLKEQADELVSNFQPSSATNCALALSVLVKADQIFGNPKYGQKARDIRTKIIKCALSRYPVTANLQPYQGSNSLADAYDMALMANALCDYARANKDKAAVEAAKLRFRPIVMTSLAFILGCVPLAISSGAGAASRHAIGTAVVFGMLAATLIAPLFVPLFFSLLSGWKKPQAAQPAETQKENL